MTRRTVGRSGVLSLLLCVCVSLPLASQAQDTVTRRIVDSLVRAGWRAPLPPKPDTVRVPANTAWVDETIHIVTFVIALALLATLAILTYKLGRRFLTTLDSRSAIGMRSQWGGFGGGDGGWEVTPAFSLLTLTIVLAILTAIIATAVLDAGLRWNERKPATAVDSAPVAATKK